MCQTLHKRWSQTSCKTDVKSHIKIYMKQPEQIKLEENLRFQIERLSLVNRFDLDNLKKIVSFTVTMKNGAVKSVKVKVE